MFDADPRNNPDAKMIYEARADDPALDAVAGGLQVMGEESVRFLRHDWGLEGVSGVLLYLLGLTGEILVLSSIYLVMPGTQQGTAMITSKLPNVGTTIFTRMSQLAAETRAHRGHDFML